MASEKLQEDGFTYFEVLRRYCLEWKWQNERLQVFKAWTLIKETLEVVVDCITFLQEVVETFGWYFPSDNLEVVPITISW